MTYTTQHTDAICNTPVVNFLRLIDYELLSKGWATSPIALVTNDLEAVFALDENENVVGAIAFEYSDVDRSIWIVVSGVSPSFRGKGIYRLMYETLIAHASEIGVLTIQSGVSVHNHEMMQTKKKMNLEPEFVTYTHRISNF